MAPVLDELEGRLKAAWSVETATTWTRDNPALGQCSVAALVGDAAAVATWTAITPLARNEWICWVESAKKAETRLKRIDWGRENLSDGKRRPCCWPGCPHREKGTGAG